MAANSRRGNVPEGNATGPDFLGIFKPVLFDGENSKTRFHKAIENLAQLPSEPIPVNGKPFHGTDGEGLMGFRGGDNGMSLVVACGLSVVRYIKVPKFVALVENMMEEPAKATVLLQNWSAGDGGHGGRGQILARLNYRNSALTVVQGVTGRIVRTPADIALYDVYYLRREILAAYYTAAFFQVGKESELDNMIAAGNAWKAFDVPLDPLNPFAEAVGIAPTNEGNED